MLKSASVSLLVVLALAGACLLSGTSAAQVFVRGGGDAPPGGVVVLGQPIGDGIQPLLFKLSRDDEWTDARDSLLARAGAGQAMSVIYHAEKLRARHLHDAKVTNRLGTLFKGLEAAGHYPLTAEHLDSQVKALEQQLKKFHNVAGREAVLTDILMRLDQARVELETAAQIIETGEVPVDAPKTRARVAAPTGE
ncbi:MAG: hypothetical protein ACKVX7_09590 [Planctomycetota bacterium]